MDYKNVLTTLKNKDETFSDRKPSLDKWNAFVTYLDQNYDNEEGLDLYEGGELELFWDVAFIDGPKPDKLSFRDGEEMLKYVAQMKFKNAKKVQDVEEQRMPVVKAPIDFDVTHASGIGRSLDGRPDAIALWEKLCGVGSDWTMERFTLAMTQIMKGMQGNLNGKLGVLSDITQEQYEGWLQRASGAQVNVGPFMLIKLALQNGAYIKIEGDKQVISRNGVELIIDDVYILSGDVDKFTVGILHKGRTVGYSHVEKAAYGFFDYIARSYDIVRVGQKNPKLAFEQHSAVNVSKYKYSGTVGFAHRSEVDDAVKGLVNTFNAEGIIEKDADMVIDRVVQMIQRLLTPNIRIAIDHLKKQGFAQAQKFKVTLERAAAMGPDLAKVELGKIIPHPTVKASFDYCEAMREARNRTDVSQYSLKNAGSYQGSVSVPAIDTILKGARIREFLVANKLDKIETKCMYGIAYGHMIEPLTKDDMQFQLFDINPAKKSPYQINEGNIFYADYKDTLIVDDTNTGKNIGEKHMTIHAKRLGMDKAPKPMTGDEFKVSRFVECNRTCTIISKITLGNVEKLVPILFPSKIKQPFGYVRLVKFGKMHNPEVFLILSNDPKLGIKDKNFFSGDAYICASVSSLANNILMELHTRGIGVGSLNREVMSTVWESIMKAMPRTWPWYKRVYNKPVVINKTINEMDIGVEFGDEERESWDDQREDITFGEERDDDDSQEDINEGDKGGYKDDQFGDLAFHRPPKLVDCVVSSGGVKFTLYALRKDRKKMQWFSAIEKPPGNAYVVVQKFENDVDPLMFEEDEKD